MPLPLLNTFETIHFLSNLFLSKVQNLFTNDFFRTIMIVTIRSFKINIYEPVPDDDDRKSAA